MRTRIRHSRRILLGVAGAALLSAGVLLQRRSGATRRRPRGREPSTGPARAAMDWCQPELRVPPGNRLIAQLDGEGVQVYECAAGSWTFLEPAAQLHDQSAAAIHFRGPTWESIRDGSLVEATKVVASSPVAGAVPRLLLQATLTRGDGIFGDVTFVQRLATVGGVKPSTRCMDGQTLGVPYSAVYTFYARG